MALDLTDWLLAGYLGFVTVMLAIRGMLAHPLGWWLVVMNLLFGVMLYLFTRLSGPDRFGRFIYMVYPLLFLIPFYWQIGAFGLDYGMDRAAAHDVVIQDWEAAVFGGQVSFAWIRRYPSVFWSGVLHAAYFAYYVIILLGPILLAARGRMREARTVLLSMMTAFVICYVVFIVYPVGGPYYAFPQPEGPVRDVWSARLVYWILSGGSSFGAAFPSSHVAATVATTTALWWQWRTLAKWFVIPTILLTVGTVYCQMHYGVDAASGVLVGLGAGFFTSPLSPLPSGRGERHVLPNVPQQT
jgi:membrane-associated phospholipid phosphatase